MTMNVGRFVRFHVYCSGTRESSELKSHDFNYFCRYV